MTRAGTTTCALRALLVIVSLLLGFAVAAEASGPAPTPGSSSATLRPVHPPHAHDATVRNRNPLAMIPTTITVSSHILKVTAGPGSGPTSRAPAPRNKPLTRPHDVSRPLAALQVLRC